MLLPRFYPILDLETVAGRGWTSIHAASEILDAGAQILQFRCKGFFSRAVLSDLERIVEMCRQARTTLVVNDRADLARITGAALHLGQEDLLPSEARRVTGNQTMIGYSTHNQPQLRAALSEPADYLAIGPIFGTTTKQHPDPVVGLDELRRLRPLSNRPLAAIGGITRSNASAVFEAGADSVAVIGDLFPTDGRIRDRVKEWLAL